MRPFPNKVIVFGSSHHNTLGLIRSLGEEGISPYLVLHNCKSSSFVAKSRYITQTTYTDDTHQGLDYIIHTFADKEQKGIILCSDDDTASIVDAHYDQLKPYFFVQNGGSSNSLNPYFNKQFICQRAEEWGFEVPLTISHNRTQPLPQDIHFPCLIKPQQSILGHKSDIHICHNREALISSINALSKQCDNFLIQQYINKEYEISILGVSLKKQVILPCIIHKLREYPVGHGNSSFACLEEIPPELNLQPLYKAIQETHYTGLFSIEFVKQGNHYYFLEINFRNDGNGYVITHAGLNEPYIYCLDMLDQLDYSSIPSTQIPFFFMSARDCRHIANKAITFSQWRKDHNRTQCFLQYNHEDPAPTHGRWEQRIQLLSNLRKRLF